MYEYVETNVEIHIYTYILIMNNVKLFKGNYIIVYIM